MEDIIMVGSVPTHGDSGTSLYQRWSAFIERCTNKNNKAYHNYGGRGIGYAKEWKKYSKFKEWAMLAGYSPELSLDRIDNDQGYFPFNCRWATRATQGRNRQNNLNITYNGETKCMTDWCNDLGLNYGTVNSRYRKGIRGEKLFAKKIYKNKAYLIDKQVVKNKESVSTFHRVRIPVGVYETEKEAIKHRDIALKILKEHGYAATN